MSVRVCVCQSVTACSLRRQLAGSGAAAGSQRAAGQLAAQLRRPAAAGEPAGRLSPAPPQLPAADLRQRAAALPDDTAAGRGQSGSAEVRKKSPGVIDRPCHMTLRPSEGNMLGHVGSERRPVGIMEVRRG